MDNINTTKHEEIKKTIIKAQNTFVIHNNWEDKYIKVPERVYKKYIESFAETIVNICNK